MSDWICEKLRFKATNSVTGKQEYINTVDVDLSWVTFPVGTDSSSSQSFDKNPVTKIGTAVNTLDRKAIKYTLENGNYIANGDNRPAPYNKSGGLLDQYFWDRWNNNPQSPPSAFINGSNNYIAKIFNIKAKVTQWAKISVNFSESANHYTVSVVTGSKVKRVLDNLFKDIVPEPVIDFPYGPESKPGGGGGSFDPSGDQIETPSRPEAGAGGSGFVTLYRASAAQVKGLYDFLWSDFLSVDTFKKLFNDPMEALISFGAIPDLSTGGVQKNIMFGNLDSGIQSVEIGQFQRLNCGSIMLAEFFGSALDYAPYTQLTIFLPYIGYQELNANDFMGKEISVEYTVDMLSGACVAFIKAGATIVNQFTGNCLSPIPITARDQTDIYKGALSAAAVVAGAVVVAASAGTAAPAVGTAVTSAGTPLGGAAAAGLGAKGVALAAGGALSAANIATTARPHYQRSGSINGASGLLGVQTPYLIIERPDQSLAHDYNKFVGFPSNLTLKLGELAGFTQVESIRLDGFAGASAAEISEIDSLLKSGVIL